jgi:glycosyltransferase involved in cell wall biosynthesis
MRIGVDATSWGNRRGFGRFARNAVGRLVALDGEHEYVFVADAAALDALDVPPGARVRPVRLARRTGEAAAADSARSPLDLARLSATAARGRLDAMLFPSVYTYFPAPGVPEVVGIHDAIADELPDLTLPSRRARAFWQAKEGLAVRRARIVFTVSDASRAVLARRFGLERVPVVPEAPDPVFGPRAPDATDAALAPLGLRASHYLLYAGGISPHKNVPRLLEAVARLREERGGERGRAAVPPLVIVGELEGDPFLSAAGEVRRRVEKLGIQDAVVLPGFVSDEALACLYGAAAAVVLPSLSEGFGLPAVEAAACGAPVLCSDLPSHRASMGDAARYFDPHDADALASAIAWALDEPERARELGARARERVAPLSWDASARALRALLDEAAGR